MPSIIYRTDARTGNIFAYKSTSYRDPVSKRPRTKQEYLGRVDPVTREILPKGTDGKRNRTSSTKQLNDAEERIASLQQENEYLSAKDEVEERFFETIMGAIQQREENLKHLKQVHTETGEAVGL